MPVREHCEVALRERCLRTGQRVETDLGVGKDLSAVALRDGAMVVGALSVLAAFEPAGTRRADLVLRLETDALSLVAAVVDARFDSERLQLVVDVGSPTARASSAAAWSRSTRAASPQTRPVPPRAESA